MNRELPLPRPFDGDAVALKPSVWITNHDVTAAGGRIEATMAEVFSYPTATMPDGRVVSPCNALHFLEDVKPLVLTADDNIGPLIRAFGKDVKAWPGNRVVLFNKLTRRDGMPCLGVRVRKLNP